MEQRDPDENGWQSSADAWIKRMHGDQGDFARKYVLDRPLLSRVTLHKPKSALDVGCGEGRFCRQLAKNGVVATGLDISPPLLEEAKRRDPDGNYVEGVAEELPFSSNTFDLVISCLSLIDIDGAEKAITEMARVVNPGGIVLVANLTSFSTSSSLVGRRTCKDTGEELRPLGDYLTARKDWLEWDGMRIQNWHRPLGDYMTWFLNAGLTLTYFDEPEPKSATSEQTEHYRQMPFLMIMEWKK